MAAENYSAEQKVRLTPTQMATLDKVAVIKQSKPATLGRVAIHEYLLREDEIYAALPENRTIGSEPIYALPDLDKAGNIADYFEYIAAGTTTGVAADDGAVKVRLPLAWEIPTDFIVKVYGDSMCGIVEDGELAAFVRDAEPGIGDIVAAVVDGQTMLKMIAMEGVRKVLISLNPDRKKYPPIKTNKHIIYRGKFVAKYSGPIERIEDHG